MIDDDAGRRRRETGAAGRLYGTQRDQRENVLCQPAEQGRDGERRHRSQEHAAAPVALAEPTADRQHQHEAERIRGDRPAGPVDRGAEPGLHRMQRGGDDRRVDRHHQQGERHGDKHRNPAHCRRGGRLRRRLAGAGTGRCRWPDAHGRASMNRSKKAASSSCASSGSTCATYWSGRTTTRAPRVRSMPRCSKIVSPFVSRAEKTFS